MWFQFTENSLFCAKKDELNEGELCWLLEGIVTVENILPQQTKFGKRNFVYIFTWTYKYMKNSQSISCSAIWGVGGIVDR